MTRLLVLSVLLNTLIVAAGVGAAYMLLKPDAAAEGDAGSVEAPREYAFHPVERIVVSMPGERREHYVVLDLLLMADAQAEEQQLVRIEPIVRNSVVAYLSAQAYTQLRALPIPELQQRLQEVLVADLAEKRVRVPFEQVLVSKMLVQ